MTVPENSKRPARVNGEADGLQSQIPEESDPTSAYNPVQSDVPVSGEADSSQDQTPVDSAPGSRSSSRAPKKSARIHWRSEGESMDIKKQKSTFNVRDHSSHATEQPKKPLPKGKERDMSRLEDDGWAKSFTQDVEEAFKKRINFPPKPILRRSSSDITEKDVHELSGVEEEVDGNSIRGKALAERTALSKAQKLSRDLGIKSAPGSRLPTPAGSPPPSPTLSDPPPLNFDDIPLERLHTRRQNYSIEDNTDAEDSESDQSRSRPRRFYNAAKRLVRKHTGKSALHGPFRVPAAASSQVSLRSGQVTPERRRHGDYVPKPKTYMPGILSSFMRVYNEQGIGAATSSHPIQTLSPRDLASQESLVAQSGVTTPIASSSRNASSQSLVVPSGRSAPIASSSRETSGLTTPKRQKWYDKDRVPSASSSVSNLVSSSRSLAQPTAAPITQAEEATQEVQGQRAVMRPQPTRSRSSQVLSTVVSKFKPPKASENEFKVHLHVADVMKRHQFLLKICKALITYGAPTHRLEEVMRMCARALEVEAQFLYLPGCMLVSFDDSGTHTTELRIVRTAQGVHLSKLRDTHEIYKEVIHDMIDLDQAMELLEEITRAKDRFPPWVLVGMYGLASMCVGPFAFGARLVDLPFIFILGSVLGFLHIIVAPITELYANVFEVTAALSTSFLARALGSMRYRGGTLLCFSALAQSSIALILPGYIVLCASLELQSRNILAGSVRMVYAVIYSLFLGFGITLGAAFYGAMDKGATSDLTCQTKNPIWWPFIFVPPCTVSLIIINQGKWKQMPIMVFIAMSGYTVNYWSTRYFNSNPQVAQTLSALTIGVMGNIYSRARHGLSAASLLPAIFVLVPSGLAASGSLVAGIASANKLTDTPDNGTLSSNGSMDPKILTVGFEMIQVAIGITVGLFLGSLLLYPFGKRRSGLFSF